MESDYLRIEEAEDIISTNSKQIEIEQEIECPRCHDMMILSSEFDRFGYFCEECSFLLYLS
jgi:DNA-directed RNA polymerase subunit RPC12/RpoP